MHAQALVLQMLIVVLALLLQRMIVVQVYAVLLLMVVVLPRVLAQTQAQAQAPDQLPAVVLPRVLNQAQALVADLIIVLKDLLSRLVRASLFQRQLAVFRVFQFLILLHEC